MHQGSGSELQAGTAGLGQRGEFINPLLKLLCLFHWKALFPQTTQLR